MKLFLTLLSAITMMSVTAQAGNGAKVDPPYEAPAVKSLDQDGKEIDFSEVYKNNKYVVVFFYPKADTPGCTKQSCSLRDVNAELKKEGVQVIGVSADGVEAQKKFAEKFSLPYPLVADKEGNVIKAFKVQQMPNGLATRQAFLIKEGKVVWHDPKASTEKQADDIKKALASLK